MRQANLNHPAMNRRATQQRPINRAYTQTQARFIGRYGLDRRFIACRGWPFALLAILFLSSGCQQANPTAEIIVFAASSLTDAFTEIATAYENEQPDTKIIFNFAGSSQLAAQLREGAPADLFASANVEQMQTIVVNGRIAANTVQPFATNQLTIITPADNPAQIDSLADLTQPDLLLILAAPGVPVRTYTDQIVSLQSANFQTNFYANLISEEENVRQVAAKIGLGEADAGIVYRTDVTPDLATQLQQIPIPAEQNVVAIYPLAPLVDAPNSDGAAQFVAFVLSAQGQAILAKWGFLPLQ
jgi:molybdate transport system substrate-binding protein